MARVHVLHENPAWFAPLGAALERQGVPYAEWFIDKASIALDRPPPAGVFFNRLSGSAHTRGHRLSVEHARVVLRWLEAHGRRIVNGPEALEIAMSKSALLSALAAAGIRTPRTVVAVGVDRLAAAAASFPGSILLKPNRSGKGIGIRHVPSADRIDAALLEELAEESVDGVWLVQEYIAPAGGAINRLEFVGGELLYALRSDARSGFNLCPADDC